jgi:hypothetical protein
MSDRITSSGESVEPPLRCFEVNPDIGSKGEVLAGGEDFAAGFGSAADLAVRGAGFLATGGMWKVTRATERIVPMRTSVSMV